MCESETGTHGEQRGTTGPEALQAVVKPFFERLELLGVEDVQGAEQD